jgi:lysophospholipase L1-like esterase
VSTIVLFGDSLLARLAKPRLRELDRLLGGDNRILNCATGGWDTSDGARVSDLIAELAPDVVVLSFGMNDFAPWKRVPLAEFRAYLARIVRDLAPARIVALLPPAVVEVPPGSEPARTNADLDEYRRVVVDLVGAAGSLDADRLFQMVGLTAHEVHAADGVHLSNEAYDAVLPSLAGIISAL